MHGLLSFTLRSTVGLLDKASVPRVSVLIFHRVTPEPDPLFPLEMHAQRFDRLMQYVAGVFNVLTVRDAQEGLLTGKLPARALAITFDDGYADNAEYALPILQRHGLRATFFVATGFLNGGRMWNDSVIELLRRTTKREIDASCFACGVLPLTNTAERMMAIGKILPVVKYKTLSERHEALVELSELCGTPSVPDDLMMSSEQVRQLHRAGMEIGGHTVNHPILTAIDDVGALREISLGRAALEEILGSSVTSFAYPNGGPGVDYALRHTAMVRQAGFSCAVTTAAGTVGAESDAMQWPRFTPWDGQDRKWLARLALQRYRGAMRPQDAGTVLP